jgi:Ca2+-binding RTX toxin-like protein
VTVQATGSIYGRAASISGLLGSLTNFGTLATYVVSIAGADEMNGGAGDDTYAVDNAGDRIIDASGTDAVLASDDYVFANNLESLRLVGTARSGTGNRYDNVITGNGEDNILNGRGGLDRLTGGGGRTGSWWTWP